MTARCCVQGEGETAQLRVYTFRERLLFPRAIRLRRVFQKSLRYTLADHQQQLIIPQVFRSDGLSIISISTVSSSAPVH